MKKARQEVGIVLAECVKRSPGGAGGHGEEVLRLSLTGSNRLLLSTHQRLGSTWYLKGRERLSFPVAALSGLAAALQGAEQSPVIAALAGPVRVSHSQPAPQRHETKRDDETRLPGQRASALALHAAGKKPADIAAELRVGRATVYRWLKGLAPGTNTAMDTSAQTAG